ncbi:MAG: hypothetical protein PF481_01425 [Bacteroidales bacterium]|jgi:hypothetical protein|nr:hypothetical protein [Bacteroidales bacterium]
MYFNKQVKIGLLIVFAYITCSAVLHPVHISYTKIHVQTDSIQFLTKIYTHDVEFVFGNSWRERSEAGIEEIYNKQMVCATEIQDLYMSIDSCFEKDEFYWVYAHVKMPSDVHSFLYSNSLLCEIFEEQKNLCIVSVENSEKGYVLDCKNQNITINLQ